MILLVVILFALLTFGALCNGYVLREVEEKAYQEELAFHEAWDAYVEECQGNRVVALMMKLYYIIPTLAGVISSCKRVEDSEESET